MNSYCWFEVAYFGEYHNADWQKMTYMSFILRKILFAKPLPKLQMLFLFNEPMLIHTNGYEIECHMSVIGTEERVLIHRYIISEGFFSRDSNPIIPLHLSLVFLNHNFCCEINNQRIDIYIFKLVNTFKNVLVK